MRLVKSTTWRKRTKKGFSIAEIIFAVTAMTIVLTSMVGTMFLLHNGFERVKWNASRLMEMGAFLEEVTQDVYSIDTYPRYAGLDFEFTENRLNFTVMGTPVEYGMEEGVFKIKRGKKTKSYDFIKEFKVKYFDENDFETMEGEYPYYCVMSFTFNGKQTRSVTVKL